VPHFLLHHRHSADDCAVAFAAWKGFASPLREGIAVSTCLAGDHSVWWQVTADDRHDALALLPRYVAERTNVIEIREVHIP
jgi:hypothetical protein